MKIRFALVPALLLLAPSAQAADKHMTDVPLVWKPTSTLAETVGALNLLPLASAKVWIAPFTDSRSDKSLIAQNLEEKAPRPVTTKEDVPAFLATHAKDIYHQAGLSLAASEAEATVVVKVEVARCLVTEQDTYKGELNLVVEVDKGGTPLWRGTVMGENTRWGRSYKLENYYETISDSLMDAVGKTLKSPAFLDALAGKAAN